MQFGEGITDKIKNASESIKKAHQKVTNKINLIGKDIKQSDLFTNTADFTNELYNDGEKHTRTDCKVFVSIKDAKKIKAALNQHISKNTKEYLSCTKKLTKELETQNEIFNKDTVISSMSDPEKAKKRVSDNQHKIAECNKKFLSGINKKIDIDSNDVKCILTLKKVNSTKIDNTTRNVTTFEGNVVGIDPKKKTIIVKVDASVKKGHEIEIKIENLCVGGKEMPKAPEKEDKPKSEEVNEETQSGDDSPEEEIAETNVDEKIMKPATLKNPIETREELRQACDRIEKGQSGGSGRRKY